MKPPLTPLHNTPADPTLHTALLLMRLPAEHPPASLITWRRAAPAAPSAARGRLAAAAAAASSSGCVGVFGPVDPAVRRRLGCAQDKEGQQQASTAAAEAARWLASTNHSIYHQRTRAAGPTTPGDAALGTTTNNTAAADAPLRPPPGCVLLWCIAHRDLGERAVS